MSIIFSARSPASYGQPAIPKQQVPQVITQATFLNQSTASGRFSPYTETPHVLPRELITNTCQCPLPDLMTVGCKCGCKEMSKS